MAKPSSASSDRPRRSPLRKAAIASLSALAVWLTGVGTYQVLRQSVWSESGSTSFSCHTGTAALYSALESARAQSADHNLNEREAVSKFRADLDPVWSEAHAIARRCEEEQDKVALKALRSVELLRYAEERSIRLSAVDLTKLRRSTPRLVRALSNQHALSTSPTSAKEP